MVEALSSCSSTAARGAKRYLQSRPERAVPVCLYAGWYMVDQGSMTIQHTKSAFPEIDCYDSHVLIHVCQSFRTTCTHP